MLHAAEGEYRRHAEQLSDARRVAGARFARELVSALGDLAMGRTRFEVRFEALAPEAWGSRGLDQVEFFVSPNPGEDLRPLTRVVSGGELSRLMLAIKTLTSRTGKGATLIFDEVDAGIGGHTADVVGRRLQGLAADAQVLCITHLPQIAAAADQHYRITKSVRGQRTVTEVERLDADGRRQELARMIAGQSVTDRRAGQRRRDARRAPTGERRIKAERRKRKSQGEGAHVSRKYFIETYGCQMNYHDSEQMAGLLEAAGYDRTSDDGDADVVVINTCSVREHAEDKLYTRLGELRVQAHDTGRDPMVVVTGCVAQQEGESLLKRSAMVDVVVGTRRVRMLPLLVEQAARTHVAQVDLGAHDNVAFPFGVTRRDDPVRAWVTIIEGCNEYCSFCVVPVHARPRAHAAEGRDPGRSARRRRPRPARSPAPRANRQSLPGARRSGLRLRGAAGSGPRGRGHRADPVCQPASAPRDASADRGDSRPPEGLQAPPPARAIGLLAGAQADAPPLHARRATWRWSTSCGPTCRGSR